VKELKDVARLIPQILARGRVESGEGIESARHYEQFEREPPVESGEGIER